MTITVNISASTLHRYFRRHPNSRPISRRLARKNAGGCLLTTRSFSHNARIQLNMSDISKATPSRNAPNLFGWQDFQPAQYPNNAPGSTSLWSATRGNTRAKTASSSIASNNIVVHRQAVRHLRHAEPALMRKSSSKSQRHVRLHHFLIDCHAWRSLEAVARAIYIEIARRYAGPGSNNGRIPYSVREAVAALNIGKTTACRAMQALQDRGFIVCTRKGAFSLKTRHATEWRLTEHPCDVSHTCLGSKEFMRWMPPPPLPPRKAGRTIKPLTPWYTSRPSHSN